MGRLRKKEYIEKFGEDAWKAFLERAKIQNREYKTKHRKELAEKQREYYLRNKGDISTKRKESYRNNIEEYKEKHRLYYTLNKEDIKQRSHKYYHENSEKIKKVRNEDPDKRAKSLINSYKTNDIKYNREGFNLTSEWVVEHIFNSSCVYCGKSDWTKLGCDRIDNTKAHTQDNCVCACRKCNILRKSEDFKTFLLSRNPSGASDILTSLGLQPTPMTG